MWIVEPDSNADGSSFWAIIHLNAVVHAAHLMGVCDENFLPEDFTADQSLNAFLAFYVNKCIDHLAFEIAK